MKLGRMFSRGLVDKTYWAIVQGVPPAAEGRIDLPLLKVLPETGGWRISPNPAGLPAVTEYRVLGSGSGLSWLELRPLTGRTHQLRIHCALDRDADRGRSVLWRFSRTTGRPAPPAGALGNAAAKTGCACDHGDGTATGPHAASAQGPAVTFDNESVHH